jgi:type VI secretion system secreted protein Hcp
MAQCDYFLKLDGIEGESSDAKHKGEFEIFSWSLGATNNGTFGTGTGGGGAGKVAMQDMHLTKSHCKASPKLLLACSTGQHIKSALLTCRKAGGDQLEFIKITLSDVLVSSYQTGGSASGDSLLPTDQFTLNFAKIEHAYTPQDSTGAGTGEVKAGYDLKKSQKV